MPDPKENPTPQPEEETSAEQQSEEQTKTDAETNKLREVVLRAIDKAEKQKPAEEKEGKHRGFTFKKSAKVVGIDTKKKNTKTLPDIEEQPNTEQPVQKKADEKDAQKLKEPAESPAKVLHDHTESLLSRIASFAKHFEHHAKKDEDQGTKQSDKAEQQKEKPGKDETSDKKTKEQKPLEKITKRLSYKPSFLVFILNLVITIVLLGGLIIALVGVGVYQSTFFSQTTVQDITELIPYPAGIINSRVYTIAEYRSDIAALNRFYAVQVDAGLFNDFPEDSRVQDVVWERYVQNILMQEIADEYGVVVSEEDLQAELQAILNESGGLENLEKQIAFLYGWDVDTFMQKVIRPFVLREKLAAFAFRNESLRNDKKDLAESIAEAVMEQPELFAQYAQEYSEDEVSRESGGDIGYIQEGAVPSPLTQTIQGLDVGEVSDVVETGEGFEIFYVENIDLVNGINRYQVRRILIRYPSFEELLADKRMNATIYRFVH